MQGDSGCDDQGARDDEEGDSHETQDGDQHEYVDTHDDYDDVDTYSLHRDEVLTTLMRFAP